MEGEVACVAGSIPIFGRSRAGQESYYRIPSFRSALEIGRCPDSLVSVPFVFITHAHLDHAAGVATYASQRTLHEMAPGRVFLPAEIRDSLANVVELHRQLEKVDAYQAVLTGVEPGDSIRIRGDLFVRAFRGCHRVPTVGFTFLESKRKLKAEFRNLASAELAALRRRGTEIAAVEETALLAYPGDSTAEIFEVAPEILRARVLLLECTFLRPEDEGRAPRYSHLHLNEIARRASDFQNEALILTHFSARYSREEILLRLQEDLPSSLRDRTIAFV
jgi:ribonuclease Z